MTNQKAIGELSALTTRQPDYAVALDKAISALQAQEAKNSNESSSTQKALDTISRQAAIDEIRKCRFVVDAIEKIIGLPSAQPEPQSDAYTKAVWKELVRSVTEEDA